MTGNTVAWAMLMILWSIVPIGAAIALALLVRFLITKPWITRL
jgi:hypothetical protein